MQENLKVRAQQLLAAVGLSSDQLIDEAVHPDSGDGEVVFHVGSMYLRFVRDRRQEFLDVSPGD